MSEQILFFTTQYLVAFLLVFVVSFYIFIKNPKSKSYQAFLSFGLVMAIWLIAVFIGRNAPSKFLAMQTYLVIGVMIMLVQPLILLSLLFLWKERKIHIMTILPAIIFSVGIIVFAPYDVVWTELGWSYSLGFPAVIFTYVLFLAYLVSIIFIALFLAKKSFLKSLRKKYLLFAGGIILYAGLLLITNLLIYLNPAFPPVGGILAFIEFIIIAYAVSLPTEKIVIPPGKPLETIANDWLKFLRKLRELVPGKELGEDIPRFEKGLHAMGLAKIVRYENGKLVFSGDQLAPLGINELVNGTTDFVRKQNWPLQAIKEYTNVFVDVYKALSKTDEKVANGFLNAMIRKYGGFLDKQGVLNALPEDAKIPKIFEESKVKRTYLFKEERPTKAYEKLREVLQYGFKSLILSKLEPKKVKERYKITQASIFWLTFKEAENTINPKRLKELEKMVAEFVKKPSRSVVLFDCFEQIRLVNGFEKSMSMLRGLKELCAKNNANLLISISPEMFEAKQMAILEKEIKGER